MSALLESIKIESSVDERGNTPQALGQVYREGRLLTELKSQLTRCLCSPLGLGFASSGTFPLYPDPDIFISGLGNIPVPLSVDNAKRILALNYREDGHAIIKSDTKGINSSNTEEFELDTDKFDLKNPDWSEDLKAVVDEAATQLGVTLKADIKAVLYKMILHGKGAMFKKYPNLIPEPGMIGTLIICLPSVYTGGEFHITCGKLQRDFKIETSSKRRTTYLCWREGLEPQVTKVTSGYRFALQYHLIIANPIMLAGAPIQLANRLGELEDAFQLWKHNCGKGECLTALAWKFEHSYEKESFSFDKLKEGDRFKAHYLKVLFADIGFSLFLATLNCRSSSEINSAFLKLQHIVDINGIKVLDTALIKESDVIQEERFHDDLNQEDISDSFKTSQVAIFMPTEYGIEFCFRSYKASETDMRNLLEQALEYYECTNDSRDLLRLCQLIVNGYERPTQFTDDLLGKVMTVSLYLKDSNLCRDAISALVKCFPQPTTAEVIRVFGFTDLNSQITYTIRHFPLARGLNALIDIYDEYLVLIGKDSSTQTDILEWMQREVMVAYSSGRVVSAQDGDIAARVGIKCTQEYLMSTLVPAVESCGWSTTAIFGFLNTIYEGWKSRSIKHANAYDVFSRVLGRINLSIHPPNLSHHYSAKRKRSGLTYIGFGSKEIGQLLKQCLSLNLSCRARDILTQLGGLARREQPATAAFGLFFLPLAQGLDRMSLDASLERLKLDIQKLEILLLELYVTRCAGPRPGVEPISGGKKLTWLATTEQWEQSWNTVKKEVNALIIQSDVKERINSLLDRMADGAVGFA